MCSTECSTACRNLSTTKAPPFVLHFSPVTLSNELNDLQKLIIVTVCSIIGTLMNGFFVSTFFVERTLKGIGNVFLACTGVTEMFPTFLVLPVISVVLVSGQWDNLPVCKALHFLMTVSTYCYSLFFAMVSFEMYYRMCRTPKEYIRFLSMRLSLVVGSIFALSFVVAGFGVYADMDYDYCRRRHYGNIIFRLVTFGFLHVVPGCVTIIGLTTTLVYARRRIRDHAQCKRTRWFSNDYSILKLNIIAYLFYVIIWTPYTIVVFLFPSIDDSKFYYSVWIAVFRSVVSSFLYGISNANFRSGYHNLINYCCFKDNLSRSYLNRHRAAGENRVENVSVHLMHAAMNAKKTQKNRYLTREIQEL